MNKYPSHLNLGRKELAGRIQKAWTLLLKCSICPRNCGVNRLGGEKGFCRALDQPIISAYNPHFGE